VNVGDRGAWDPGGLHPPYLIITSGRGHACRGVSLTSLAAFI